MANERKVPILRSENSLIDQEFDSIREKFEHEMSKMEEEMSRFRSQLIASERDRLISTQSTTSMSTSSSRLSSHSTASKSSQQQQIHEQGLEMAKESLAKQQQQQQMTSKVTASQKSTSKSESIQSISSSASKQSHEQTNKQPTIKSTGQFPERFSSESFKLDNSSLNWLHEINSPLIKESEDGKILRLRFDVNNYEPEQIIVKTVDNRLQIHARREEKSDSMSMYREYNREFLLPEGTDPELIRSSLSADGVLTVEAPIAAPLPLNYQ